MSIDYESLPFERPSKQIKTLDMGPVPKRIFDGMKQYEDASRYAVSPQHPSWAQEYALRGYALIGFDRRAPGATVDTYLIQHRPKDATVAQVYRIPVDPKSTNIERLTYFETGAGHTYESFQPIIGEDWRGRWRPGGAILSFDLDGSENFQLWRYWEDNQIETSFPKIDGELDNKPGIGRIERITHDNFKYANVRVSHSNRYAYLYCEVYLIPHIFDAASWLILQQNWTGATLSFTFALSSKRISEISMIHSRWI